MNMSLSRYESSGFCQDLFHLDVVSLAAALRPSSTISICCGFVGQQPVQRIDVDLFVIFMVLCCTTCCGVAADFGFVVDVILWILCTASRNKSSLGFYL